MFMVHLMVTIRSSFLVTSYFQPFGTATASTMTPSGTSSSAPTVATLLSVGTRITYFSVAPAIDWFGVIDTWALAAAGRHSANAVTIIMAGNWGLGIAGSFGSEG